MRLGKRLGSVSSLSQIGNSTDGMSETGAGFSLGSGKKHGENNLVTPFLRIIFTTLVINFNYVINLFARHYKK